MPARPLTAPEREELHAGIERRESNGETARQLDQRRTRITPRINHNGCPLAYTTTAQTRSTTCSAGVTALAAVDHPAYRRGSRLGG